MKVEGQLARNIERKQIDKWLDMTILTASAANKT